MSRLWLKSHPNPATGKKISLGLDESFRAAKQNLDLVKTRYSKVKEEVASAETSVLERENQFSIEQPCLFKFTIGND